MRLSQQIVGTVATLTLIAALGGVAARADCPAELRPASAATGDAFGFAVALDGAAAIIGASHDDTAGVDAGAAYIYRLNNAAWTVEATLRPADLTAWNWFGRSVALSGDVAVVGAPRDDDAGGQAGATYVFRFDGTAWQPEGKLLAADAAAGDEFGTSVAIAGDVLVVGAPRDDDNGSSSGAAYVFRHDGTSWTQETKLTASDAAALDGFGAAVAIAGDVIVIGTPQKDAGAAYVYRYDAGAWSEEQKLTATVGAVGDWFGAAVSVAGDLVAVGAWGDHDNGTDAGAAYIFRHDTSNWTQEAKLLPAGVAAQDNFGAAVSLTGDIVLVGAPHHADVGAAYVFQYDGAAWPLAAELAAGAPVAQAEFGAAVGVSGSWALCGSWGDDTGAAWIFGGLADCDANGEMDISEVLAGTAQDCNGNCIPDACDIAAGTSADCQDNGIPDECDIADGTSQDVGGDGVPDECQFDCNENNVSDLQDIADGTSHDCQPNGIPDECDIADGTSLDDNLNGVPDECESRPCDATEFAQLVATDAAGEVHFGRSLAIAGDVAVLGAPQRDDQGDASGAAYVFRFDPGPPGMWAEELKLLPTDVIAGDEFGGAVAITDDLLAVGAPYADASDPNDPNATLADAGAVYVFRHDGATWTQEARLTVATPVAARRFGAALALTADTLVVGAPGDDHAGADTGAVHTFHFDPNAPELWVAQATLLATNPAAGDTFGSSVAFDGEYAVIGAPSRNGVDPNDPNSVLSDTGAVYVFHAADPNWPLLDTLQPAALLADDHFGTTVGISQDMLVVGAPDDDEAGDAAGLVYTFKLDADHWTADATVQSDDAAAGQRFGASVALAGGTILVGAPGAHVAYAFRYDDTAWKRLATLRASDGAADDDFAATVAMSGPIGLVGASLHDDPNAVDAGAVYAYHGLGDCNGNGMLDLCDPGNGVSGDCNLNGVLDSCDIHDKTSTDCDHDGQPDECQPDADADGTIDACDDCPDDPNKVDPGQCGCGVPDTDTDNDGVADCSDECPDTPEGVEVTDTGCPAWDCNGNLIDDQQDVRDGTSEDCDGNLQPDECQRDGDDDGVIDRCDNCKDEPNPDQADSDGNGVGDACQPGVAGPPAPDIIEPNLPQDPNEGPVTPPDNPGQTGQDRPPITDTTDLTDQVRPITCGTGACGGNIVGWLPLSLLSLTSLKLGWRRRL